MFWFARAIQNDTFDIILIVKSRAVITKKKISEWTVFFGSIFTTAFFGNSLLPTRFKLSGSRLRIAAEFSFSAAEVSPCMLKAVKFKTFILKIQLFLHCFITIVFSLFHNELFGVTLLSLLNILNITLNISVVICKQIYYFSPFYDTLLPEFKLAK